jgi:hypothetical protein
MEKFNVKIAAVKGFTKEEALSSVNFDASFKNATQAWVKAGKPTYGTSDFKVFATEYLKKATKGMAGAGAHVVIESGIADSRERPYKVITVSNEGTRKYSTVYQIVEAELKTKTKKVVKLVKGKDEDGVEIEMEKEVNEVTAELVALGTVVDTASKKGEAEAKMKEWISETKRDFIINVVKVTDHNPVVSYGIYTPSTSAKEGTYIAFGVEVL